jgi:hypothetical protein
MTRHSMARFPSTGDDYSRPCRAIFNRLPQTHVYAFLFCLSTSAVPFWRTGFQPGLAKDHQNPMSLKNDNLYLVKVFGYDEKDLNLPKKAIRHGQVHWSSEF